MTQDEWAGSEDPSRLLSALTGTASDRKLRLFNCACCRRVWHLLGDARSRAAVEAGELFADGRVELSALRAAAEAGEQAGEELEPSHEANGVWGHSISHSAADPAKAARAAWLAAWEGGRAPTYRPGDQLYAVIDAAQDCAAAAGWHAATDADRASREHFEKSPLEARWEAISRAVKDRDVGRDAERRAQVELIHDIFGQAIRPLVFDSSWRTSTVTALARGMYESRDFGAMPILADALQDARCDSDDILNHCRDVKQVHVRGCWAVDLLLGKE